MPLPQLCRLAGRLWYPWLVDASCTSAFVSSHVSVSSHDRLLIKTPGLLG